MRIRSTAIDGVTEVETDTLTDSRGRFFRAFCDLDLSSCLCGRTVRQTNISITGPVGAIRGMHFQYPPQAEMKLIRCIRGRVWDVALDLRHGSRTFMKWHAVELSERSANMIVIPEGCSHGFQVMESDSELLYMHTAPYAPEYEGAVRYDDPMAGIMWPLAATNVSEKDRSYPLLAKSFQGVAL